jgi:Mce-associated membrane protein
VEPTEPADVGLRAGRELTTRRQTATLGAAAVILAGFAAWSGIQAHDARARPDEPNLAVTDRALTGQVSRAVASTVGTVFSYSYADPAATRRAAQRLLTGTAIRQYDRLFALVLQKAPREKLVLRTKVTGIGVELLTDTRARLLVFVDQQDRAGSGQAVYSGAMFAVTAVRTNGRWLIDDINTFSN